MRATGGVIIAHGWFPLLSPAAEIFLLIEKLSRNNKMLFYIISSFYDDFEVARYLWQASVLLMFDQGVA